MKNAESAKLAARDEHRRVMSVLIEWCQTVAAVVQFSPGRVDVSAFGKSASAATFVDAAKLLLESDPRPPRSVLEGKS